MDEMYWITRVDGILIFGKSILALSLIFIVCCSLVYITIDDELNEEKRIISKMLKVSITTILFSLLVVLFLPSKKELYLIYGLGSVVEHMRGNDKMEEIPDKAIDAIMEYLEEEEGWK